MTHHQLPFCNKLYEILDQDFTFIATGEVEQERKELGWPTYEALPYVINARESEQSYQRAMNLINQSEVVISGIAPEAYLRTRLLENKNGITLRYSERIYKRGTWRFLSPRGWKLRWETYYRYPKIKQYMLCASAYTSSDLKLLGSYMGKCYRWGYFPKTILYLEEELMNSKSKEKPVLLWCGRLITWKHPEVAIHLAALLRKDGFDFELRMIGVGELEDQVRALITKAKLEDHVKFLGARTPEQVRTSMEAATIFLFTSDYQEGWGAVLNEAMNSGCAVVASHAAGAVPYLVQDGVNGYIYPSGDLDYLYRKVKYLLEHGEVCEMLGRKAYETIREEWNAEVAATRLLLLIKDLQQQGYSDRYQSGPCSKARLIKNKWFKEGLNP